MKKNYEELATKVIRFASEDVITASGDEPCRDLICRDLICKDKIIPCDLCKLVECSQVYCANLCMDCMM